MVGFVGWLDHWQTLVSGVLAIGAAGGGSALLWRQIRQAERFQATAERRRLNAARITLPLTLSGIIAYASEAGQRLAALLPQLNEMGEYGDVDPDQLPHLTAPAVPQEAVVSLKEVIEATDDRNVIALISDMAGQIQVLAARLEGLNDNIANGAVAVNSNVESYIIQAGTIYAEASALFRFARQQTDTAPSTVAWAEVSSALNIMGIRDLNYPSIHATLARYAERGTTPLLDRD